MTMNKLILAAALATSLVACQKTTYQLRAPSGASSPSAQYNDHFHLSIIGIIELSSPIDLNAACGGNADNVFEQVSVLGGIVNILLGNFIPILHVHNATVNCGAGGAPAPTAPPPAT
jgi:hypothetical protein